MCMLVLAVRVYEPWSIATLLAAVLLIVGTVVVLILVVQSRNR